ncbi:MAG TPA: allophanate hydrolase, partial [Actinoplanes sp.]
MTDSGTSASDLGRACAAGRLRPSDLVEHLLDGRRTATPRNVWIATVPDGELRSRAADLDAHRDRRADLPLYGLPFAVK